LDPETDTCHEQMTRGPCPEGQLVVRGPNNGTMQCSCSASLLSHYWPETKQCYQHFQQGPCPANHSFRPSPDTGLPMCMVWG
jgi:hypothetical protein